MVTDPQTNTQTDRGDYNTLRRSIACGVTMLYRFQRSTSVMALLYCRDDTTVRFDRFSVYFHLSSSILCGTKCIFKRHVTIDCNSPLCTIAIFSLDDLYISVLQLSCVQALPKKHVHCQVTVVQRNAAGFACQ